MYCRFYEFYESLSSFYELPCSNFYLQKFNWCKIFVECLNDGISMCKYLHSGKCSNGLNFFAPKQGFTGVRKSYTKSVSLQIKFWLYKQTLKNKLVSKMMKLDRKILLPL